MTKAKTRVLHIWSDYSSTHFDQTHQIISQWPSAESYIAAGNILDNGSPILSNTKFLYRFSPELISSPSLFYKILRKISRIFYWRRLELLCRKMIIENNINTIHFHFGTTAAIMLERLKDIKARKIVSFYGMDASEALSDSRWNHPYKKMFSSAHAFIVLCEAVRKRLVQRGADASKIAIWNIPAAIERYLSIERTEPSENLNIIIAARFIEKKGYTHLLHGLKKALAIESRIYLTAIGYGPDREKIAKQIFEFGLQNHVNLIDTNIAHDFDEMYSELLKTQSVFALTSIQAANGDDEAGPALTMVKAQAAALPVICSEFPGSEITLKPYETGIYCDPYSVDSVANAILYCYKNRGKIKEFGVNGKMLVEKEFSLATQSTRLRQIYEGHALD